MFRITSHHSLASLGEGSHSRSGSDSSEDEAVAPLPDVAGVHVLDCFQVPADYDYTKSTQWNYSRGAHTPEMVSGQSSRGARAGPGANNQPVPPCCTCSSPNRRLFDDIRGNRDEAWHGSYSASRKLWQDAFVDSILGRDFASTAVPHKQPWAILTCGAYGAGKGYVRRWMEQKGIIPLRDIVHIDPDYFKTQMPEWAGYIQKCPEMAGSLTHRESGYIQEIVTELAMGAGQHVWVDGSLRNVGWFITFLKNIREQLPQYRIAIVRVFADEKTIVERAEQRGLVTGRRIPVSVLRDSIRAVNDESIRKLYPYTDVVAHVDNTRSPVLADVVFGERLLATTSKVLPKSWAGLKAAFVLGLGDGDEVLNEENLSAQNTQPDGDQEGKGEQGEHREQEEEREEELGGSQRHVQKAQVQKIDQLRGSGSKPFASNDGLCNSGAGVVASAGVSRSRCKSQSQSQSPHAHAGLLPVRSGENGEAAVVVDKATLRQ